MLKIIVSNPGAFASQDYSGNENLIQEAINAGHSVCSISYLHGKLEEEMGYDIGACLNSEECFDLKKKCYIEGIYDVEVVNYPGKCKAYLWNAHNMSRGLIVDISDSKAVNYAKQKFEKKAPIL